MSAAIRQELWEWEETARQASMHEPPLCDWGGCDDEAMTLIAPFFVPYNGQLAEIRPMCARHAMETAQSYVRIHNAAS